MKLSNVTKILLLGTLVLHGCGGGSTATTDALISKSITITEDVQVESLSSASTIEANISLGSTPKSLYLVLSNSNAISSTYPSITHNAKVATEAQAKILPFKNITKRPNIVHRPQYVLNFEDTLNKVISNSKKTVKLNKSISIAEPSKKDIAGDSNIFSIDAVKNDLSETTAATARKVVSGVSTPMGLKTLNVWVSDDSFDSGFGCIKRKCVTQTMVDALADSFLKIGTDNDIYDWVTNIFGEEWGSAPSSDMITSNDSITILLTDIDNDNSTNGGVIGYFWAKDNYKKSVISGSNERVMFYADSVLFATGEDSWDFNDFWPKEMISTLAHEFQHMIHFYQKTTLMNKDLTDTWIDEMLSESTEDLIATKIRHTSSRGVDYLDGSAGEPDNTLGRYPLFNENNTLSLTSWTNLLADYSKVNAFGAYLMRNFGGAKVLHDIMYSNYTDKQAVVEAVTRSPEGEDKNFADLLSGWGTGVMLSDDDNLVDLPAYNTGDFTYTTYGSITYDLGSVNFFNYSPQPNISTYLGRVNPEGNYYYKIGDNLTGDISINLDNLNGQTEVTLIAK